MKATLKIDDVVYYYCTTKGSIRDALIRKRELTSAGYKAHLTVYDAMPGIDVYIHPMHIKTKP